MSTNVADLRKKAKLPVKAAGGSTVAAFFEQNKAVIQAVLPKHITADRVLRIGLGALRVNPKLKECTSESLFGAVLACAQLGLEPNTPMGHAYMIPFRNNQQDRMDVQVIFGYRGLIDLARRSGQIESISAHAVRELDEFSYEYGLDEHCKHIPGDGNRGEITHFYAVAKFKGGGHAFEVMSRKQIEDIRDASQNWQSAVRYKREKKSPWFIHFEEMGRKTVIRRLYKYLPTSIEMAAADQAEGSVITTLPESKTDTLDGALEGEYETVQEDEGPDVDSAGEEFDPERHLSPDKRNQDGTFTKRPRRGKSASSPGDHTTGDPLAPYVEAMKKATSMDELNEARELVNGPGIELTDERKASMDAFYKAMQGRLEGKGDGGQAHGGDQFGDVE